MPDSWQIATDNNSCRNFGQSLVAQIVKDTKLGSSLVSLIIMMVFSLIALLTKIALLNYHDSV